MGDELRVSPSTLAEIRSQLSRGRQALEDCASSAPHTIDAGDLTSILTGMMSRALDNAARLSTGLAALGEQVGEAGTTFWETDQQVGAMYRGPGGVRAD